MLLPLSHLPLLKEQYKLFSLFLDETSICLRRHNGIINNYILKFQKSFSLHLHHLSQVRAPCLFGAHAVHVWLARNARVVRIWLARLRCASGPLAMCVWLARGVRGACLARLRCMCGACLARSWPPHLAPGV